MSLQGINHLAFITDDMVTTIRFYRDLLGLKLSAGIGHDGYRHYFFQLADGTTHVAFFEYEGATVMNRKFPGDRTNLPLALKDVMNVTTAPVAHEVDELELAGLTTEDSVLVKPPRVNEAPIHLECALHQEIKLPCTLKDNINTMIIGHVLGVHIREEVLTDGMVDLSKIKPLARLGYLQYSAVDNLFEMTRPLD